MKGGMNRSVEDLTLFFISGVDRKVFILFVIIIFIIYIEI